MGVRCTGNCDYNSNTTAYCDQVGCSMRCNDGVTCNFTCFEACAIESSNGARVIVDCPAGNCSLVSADGGDIDATCSSGCTMTCGAANCQLTCQQPATCSCNGGPCP